MIKSTTSILFASYLSVMLLMTSTGYVSTQPLNLETCMNNLLNNPPNTGDPDLRKQNILAIDSVLINYSASTSKSVESMYGFMMGKVKNELGFHVLKGASIWMMYNHGFIVKTQEITFAFDLVQGISRWQTTLPLEVIDQIQVLFISHIHSDHCDSFIIKRVIANGGYVVAPHEIKGGIYSLPNDNYILKGLIVKVYEGKHSVSTNMYEVICLNGLKLFHTGDNQTSRTLPKIENLDVLLLNAWVNESGFAHASEGMSNCVRKLNPKIMIPGHIQELGHSYIPNSPQSRVPYKWVYQIEDPLVSEKTHVMIWGELYNIS